MKRFNKFLLQVGRMIMKIFARMLLELNVHYEQTPPSGAKIFTPNHPTTTDPFLLSLVTRESLPILVNKKIFDLPIIGKLIGNAGCIPVDKENGNGKEIITKAAQILQQDAPIAVFPEGCLSPDANDLAHLHTGAVRIALTSGKSIVPVGIYLNKNSIKTHHFRRKYKLAESRWILHGQYYITIGKPMQLSGDMNDHELVRRYTNQLSHEIKRLMRVSEMRAAQQGFAWKPIIPLGTASMNDI